MKEPSIFKELREGDFVACRDINENWKNIHFVRVSQVNCGMCHLEDGTMIDSLILKNNRWYFDNPTKELRYYPSVGLFLKARWADLFRNVSICLSTEEVLMKISILRKVEEEYENIRRTPDRR